MATLTCTLQDPAGEQLDVELTVTITTTDGTLLDQATHRILGGAATVAPGTDFTGPDLTADGILPEGAVYQVASSRMGSLKGRTWYWDGHADATLDALPTESPEVSGPLIEAYDDTELRGELEAKADTADLASVATSGAYGDLTGTPTIPSTPGQVGADAAGAAATAKTEAIAAAATALATHISATDPHGDRAYTDTKLAALINGAPGLLDTLGEIAAQLATDESAVGALTTAVNAKLAKASNLSDLADPAAARTNLSLGNVTNTSDANKPVSTAQQAALDAKLAVGLPAYAGPRTRAFDPFTNIYASAAARAKIRRALGFALGSAKTSLVNILIAGDSFSSGWKATTIGGAGQNEIQTVTITGAPTGGTFTLTLAGQTTAGIAFNAAASAVATALTALSNIGAGNVTVTGAAGGPYTVMFTGALAATDMAQMTASAAGLTGGTTPAVTVTTTVGGIASAVGDDWATNLIGLFRAAGYPVTGGWVFAGVGSNPGDGRWTFSSGWNTTDTSSNYSFTSGLAGRTTTFTSISSGTILEVAWALAAGTSVTWSLDGGAQTGTLSSASATAPTVLTLTGLANTPHTITFTLPTGATYWVIAARCRTATGLSISNAGIFGSHTDDWLPTAKPTATFLNPFTVTQTIMGAAVPKFVGLSIGPNDMQHTGHTLAGMKTNLGNIVAAYQAAGIPVLQRTTPYMTTAGAAGAQAGSPLASGATWDQFLSAIYDVSDTNDTMLVDHSTVLGDSNTLEAAGLMFSDHLHLLPAGQAAIARADWRALQAA